MGAADTSPGSLLITRDASGKFAVCVIQVDDDAAHSLLSRLLDVLVSQRLHCMALRYFLDEGTPTLVCKVTGIGGIDAFQVQQLYNAIADFIQDPEPFSPLVLLEAAGPDHLSAHLDLAQLLMDSGVRIDRVYISSQASSFYDLFFVSPSVSKILGKLKSYTTKLSTEVFGAAAAGTPPTIRRASESRRSFNSEALAANAKRAASALPSDWSSDGFWYAGAEVPGGSPPTSPGKRRQSEPGFPPPSPGRVPLFSGPRRASVGEFSAKTMAEGIAGCEVELERREDGQLCLSLRCKDRMYLAFDLFSLLRDLALYVTACTFVRRSDEPAAGSPAPSPVPGSLAGDAAAPRASPPATCCSSSSECGEGEGGGGSGGSGLAEVEVVFEGSHGEDALLWLRRIVACTAAINTCSFNTPRSSLSVVEYWGQGRGHFFSAIARAFVAKTVRVAWGSCRSVGGRSHALFHLSDARGEPLRSELQANYINDAVITQLCEIG